MTQQQTLQQKRAAHAWSSVENVPEGLREKYKSLVTGLPSLILSDGIGQTLAFLEAKDGKSSNRGKTEHHEALMQLTNWMRVQGILPQDQELLKWLIRQDTTTYRMVASEALAYLSWIKRFTEAKGW